MKYNKHTNILEVLKILLTELQDEIEFINKSGAKAFEEKNMIMHAEHSIMLIN